MCRSALAFFTAAFVCLQNCRPGPAPFLRAAWVFSVVLGLGQSGQNWKLTNGNSNYEHHFKCFCLVSMQPTAIPWQEVGETRL
ncbi:Integrin beta-8 [Pteropus alecto]|uniref:Integrin beta-8 n=1 Tax=Pteropus alecto TaxID=9402 RepID=L5KLN5_PTEAL|nr:Integrin beta-8 [Pteropus alecto]